MLKNIAEGAAPRVKWHKNGIRVTEAKRQEVTEEKTSQQSVMFGKEKIEMRCELWHLHLNGWTGASSWCEMEKKQKAKIKTRMSYLAPSCHLAGLDFLWDHLACYPVNKPGFSMHLLLYKYIRPKHPSTDERQWRWAQSNSMCNSIQGGNITTNNWSRVLQKQSMVHYMIVTWHQLS